MTPTKLRWRALKALGSRALALGSRALEMRWEREADGWILKANTAWSIPRITVKPTDWKWNVYVDQQPMMPGNYSHEEGAKKQAWQYAVHMSQSLFGYAKINLVEG